MQYRPFDLIGGFYKDENRAWSVQDTVNWLPEAAESTGTRTQTKLASAPGLRQFTSLGTKPIRGAINVEGALFVVAGTQLREVKPNGTSIARGTIPGVGRVSMAYNQVKNGNQLLIATGQSAGYVWDTAASSFNVISDEGYPGAKSVAYLDSYLLQVEPFGRYWFFSDLADALSYNTLDRSESEGSPDKIVTLVVSQFEVVVFNQTTIEFFQNVGSSTGTFQNKRVLIERGCAAAQSVVKLDNSIFWLGDDGVVYRLDGYQAVPVSTGAIQAAIKENNWGQAFAFKWEDGDHKVYYLTLPDGQTWGYDVVTRLWHRRESYGLDRWRLNTLTRWNNMWIGGDYQDGSLWVLDWGYQFEGSQPLVRTRVSGVVHNNQSRLVADYIELVVNPGVSKAPQAQGDRTSYVSSHPYPQLVDERAIASVTPNSGTLRSLIMTASSSTNRAMASIAPTGGRLNDAFVKTWASDRISTQVTPTGGLLRDAFQKATSQQNRAIALSTPAGGLLRNALITANTQKSNVNVAISPTGGTLA